LFFKDLIKLLSLVLGTLRATALLGFSRDIIGKILDLVLGTLRATALLGFSGDLFHDLLSLVLGTLRATALLGLGGDLFHDLLSLVLRPLRASTLVRSINLAREYEVMDHALHDDGGYGDLGDKIRGLLGNIGDV